MAFTGAAVFQKISDRVMRVTGLSLGIGAAGTIGLFGGAGEVSLPDNFEPSPYQDVDLIEGVEVSVTMVTAEAVAPAVQVVKTTAAFLTTMTNGGAAATGGMEIYFRFH